MDIFTLLLLAFAVIVPMGVGVLYFLKAPATASLLLRMATAAYAPVVALSFMLVSVLWPESHLYNAKGVRLLWAMQAIPLLLLGSSLFFYPGPKKLHLLLLPVSLVFWVWTFGMSWILIHGM